MIEKSRLEELIKQGATIFAKNSYQIYEIAPQYFTNIQIIDDVLYCGPEIVELKNLFETKEDAEWEFEFGNITRTETLSLPTWEEFCGCKCSNEFTFFANGFEYNLFATVRNKECGEPDTLIIGINNLKMACGYDEIFEKPLTKETYIEACKLAKKLFLGEVEE